MGNWLGGIDDPAPRPKSTPSLPNTLHHTNSRYGIGSPCKSLASVFGTDGRRWDGQGVGQKAEQGRFSAHAARTGPVLGAWRSQSSRWRTGCSELGQTSRCSTGPVLGGQSSRCCTGVAGGAEGGWQKLRTRPLAPSVYGGVRYICEGGHFGVTSSWAPSPEAGSLGRGRPGTQRSVKGGGVARPPVPEQDDRQGRLPGQGLHADFAAFPCTVVSPPCIHKGGPEWTAYRRPPPCGLCLGP